MGYHPISAKNNSIRTLHRQTKGEIMTHKKTSILIKAFFVVGILMLPLYSFANDDKIIAKRYATNFPQSKGNYNGISSASDGLIYYVLCSGDLDVGAQMYSFNPDNSKITHLADLTEATDGYEMKAIPQGKSHVNFYEYKGKLYFATHVDFYKNVDGKELMGDPPPGYKPYQGGHILSYDMTTGEIEDLGIASPTGGGIIAQTMDTDRGRIYGLTWPRGEVFRYDVESRNLKQLGEYFADGEEGDGDRYQILSRSLTVSKVNGNVYFNNPMGEIYEYIYDQDEIKLVETENLQKDYLGVPVGRSMGYQWRQSIWSDLDQLIYGVHSESEYLFSLNPITNKVAFLNRLASETSKRAGVTGYGFSLGLVIGHDKRTLYHISHAYPNKAEFDEFGADAVDKLMLKNHHIIAYDMIDHKYEDLGEIVFEDGSEPIHINSLAMAKDGNFFALATLELEGGGETTDLISFPNPKNN